MRSFPDRCGIALAILLALLSAGTLAAQPPSFEIRGTVIELGTNQPIPDAEIALSVQSAGPVRINGGWEKDDAPRKARTDFSGAFRLHLKSDGNYRVEATMAGYIAPADSVFGAFAETSVTESKPSAEVRLYLTRPGGLWGTVVDDETGKPLADLRVRAVKKRGGRGFLLGDGIPAKSGPDGNFTVEGIAPGEYAIETGPQGEASHRVLAAFTDEDRKTVGQDYEHAYWPGGHGPDTVLPVMVLAGGAADAGAVRARKVPHYRILLRIPPAGCGGAGTVSVSEAVRMPRGGVALHGLGEAPCGKDLLVTGFSPGEYRLILQASGSTRQGRPVATVLFTITDQNLEIPAPLLPGVTVYGRLIPETGVKPPDFHGVRVMLSSTTGRWDAPLNEVGHFAIPGVSRFAQTVMVMGLDAGHYVKQVQYNGVEIEGATVPLDQPADTHALTFLIDDKVAAVAGTVTSGGKPATRPAILAVRWPLTEGGFLPGRVFSAHGDETGRFQIAGMPPGEYRAIAVAGESVENLRAMAISNSDVERALAGGTKIELGPRGFTDVTIEITEPR